MFIWRYIFKDLDESRDDILQSIYHFELELFLRSADPFEYLLTSRFLSNNKVNYKVQTEQSKTREIFLNWNKNPEKKEFYLLNELRNYFLDFSSFCGWSEKKRRRTCGF